MSEPDTGAGARLAALRAAFDASFARRPDAETARTEDFVVFFLGEERWAARLQEVARIVELERVVPVPSTNPALLGVVALRGVVVPVLALEHAAAPAGAGATRVARWALLPAAWPGVALAISRLDGYLRVPESEVDGRTVQAGGAAVVPIVDLAAAVASIIGDGPLDVSEGST